MDFSSEEWPYSDYQLPIYSSSSLMTSRATTLSPESIMFNGTSGFLINSTVPSPYENGTEESGGGYDFNPLPWWRQLIWSLLFGIMVIVATVGNLVVVWIVLAHKKMRSVTNYLLVNLSIADAMVSTINVIPNYIYMSTQHWPFGALYCKVVQFVAVLSICASVFSLMAIAFDRYTAIMNPLKPRMGRKVTLGIAAGIWIGGSALASPQMLYFTTFVQDSGVVVCYSEWPDGPMNESFHELLYNMFFTVFTYFIPMLVMGYTYTRVGLELWGSQSIGEATQRQLENIKSKRRVVKMMIVVVCIFATCWLPYQVYFLLISYAPELSRYSFVQEIYLAIYWLAMSNSMYNPIIYCWMNARFRRGFQQVFSWCPFVHYTEDAGPLCRGTAPAAVTRYSMTGSPEMHTRIHRNAGCSNVHIPLHVLTSSGGGSGTGAGGNGNKKISFGTTTTNSNGDNKVFRTKSSSGSCSTQNNFPIGFTTTNIKDHHLKPPNHLQTSLCINKSHHHQQQLKDQNEEETELVVLQS